jgi:GntR family transcriptional regulator, arabinose operon transcriptional repressor
MDLTNKIKREIYGHYVAVEGATAGKQLPSIRALAKELGVSAPTVCKAIEALTAEGCLVKRRGSGVYLSGEQPVLPRAERKKIGLIVHSLTEPLGHRVMEGVESMARRQGYALEIACSEYDCGAEAQCIRRMTRRQVAGMILYPVAKQNSDSNRAAWLGGDVPIIVADLYQDFMNTSRVVFDNRGAAFEMASWLFASGRRDVLFVSYNHGFRHPAVEARERGFREAARDAGISNADSPVFECDFFLTEQDTDLTALFEYLDRLQNKKALPGAVMCTTDYMAAAVVAHLRRNGISVPDEVCVTGFDNNYFDPRLHLFDGLAARWPTTRPDFRRLGADAVELLIDHIEGSGSSALVEKVLPCPLLIPDCHGEGGLLRGKS